MPPRQAMAKNGPGGAGRHRDRCAPISPKSRAQRRKFLASPDGPRVGALAFDGWDTHVNEGVVDGRLAATARCARWRAGGDRNQYGRGMARDRGRASLPSSAAPPASTAPTAPTTAPARWRCWSAARVKGGRVIADWPGLKEADLYEKRDLKPTTDLRAVLKGVLRDHLRVPDAALAAKVFPDSSSVRAMPGLVVAT